MLMTKTLGVIVFDEERPLTLMVFNVRDVACRHHFPFISTLSTIGFLDEPIGFYGKQAGVYSVPTFSPTAT